MSYLKDLNRTLTIIMAFVMLAAGIILPVDRASAATTYQSGGKKKIYTGSKSDVYYNGSKISNGNKYGIYVNDNFLVPYNSLLVKKGPKMSAVYNKATKVLILTYGGKNLKMKVNSRTIYVNGVRKSSLNTPPVSAKMEGTGVILVPIKRICSELELPYSYDKSSRAVYIGEGSGSGNTQNKADNTATNVTVSSGNVQATAFVNLTQFAFLNIIGPLATADYQRSGVLASVTLAQAINESGWGKTKLAQSGNNIFGMKKSLSGNTWAGSVWNGRDVVKIKTREEYHGRKVTITAEFRKYPSVTDSIADHSAYLINAKNGTKNRYAGLAKTKSYAKQLKIIRKGGYCTWSSYISELTKLIKKYNLTKYDIAK